VSYAIDVDPPAREQIAALPPEASIALAEVFTVLRIAPWTGKPYHPDKPTGPIRTLPFGSAGC
jgi:hypothetical protein